VQPDAVRPLLVSERARGAEGHDEDQRLRALLGGEDVVDDAGADGQQERRRAAGEPVQEVEDRVATGGVARVARRQVDDDLLAPAAERRARDRDLLGRTSGLDVGRIPRRREAAVDPVVPAVPVDADRATGDEERAEQRRAEREQDAPSPPPVRLPCRALVLALRR
jgi:hypothetical protein